MSSHLSRSPRELASVAAYPSETSGSTGFEGHYEQWSEAVYRYLIHLVGHTPTAEDLYRKPG